MTCKIKDAIARGTTSDTILSYYASQCMCPECRDKRAKLEELKKSDSKKMRARKAS